MEVSVTMPPAQGSKSGSPSIAEQVRGYIDARPVVRDALAMDIVNLSALSRQISEHLGLTSEDAVLAACRRYEAPSRGPGFQAGIRRVLSKSKLEVRTRVAILTARPSWHVLKRIEEAIGDVTTRNHPVHVVHGSESITVMTDESYAARIREAIGRDSLLKVQEDLVEINLRSPEVIEDIPGILAFLTTTLSSRGVNFVEVLSCYKDNLFILDEEDLFVAFELLNGLIEDARSG